jgi:hypothetical protein
MTSPERKAMSVPVTAISSQCWLVQRFLGGLLKPLDLVLDH